MSEAHYRSAIRSAVRGLWVGALDFNQFFDAMMAAIRRHITFAWHEGAAECNIAPDELSAAERVALQQAIAYESQWIGGFALAIEAGSKANGGKLGPLFQRAEIWIGRWEGVKSKARAMACGDRKLKWVLGIAEEHCSSCLRLAGKVKRASYWNERNILPRVHGAEWLECQGFRCDCQLLPTDEPMSKGPLPSLP